MAPLESLISHELDSAPLELKIQHWFIGAKYIKFFRRWEHTTEAYKLKLFLSPDKQTTFSNNLKNCTLEENGKFWKFTINKIKSGPLELRCNNNDNVFTVCDESCSYKLVDIDKISLSKEFGQGKVHYLQKHTGLNNDHLIKA